MNYIQSTTAESGSLLVFEIYKLCGACGKSFTYYKIIKSYFFSLFPKLTNRFAFSFPDFIPTLKYLLIKICEMWESSIYVDKAIPLQR